MQTNYSTDSKKVPESVQLYYRAELNESEIGEHSSVGDFSRVRHCRIGRHCSIDRQNFVLYSQMGDYTYTGAFDYIFQSEIGRYCAISFGVTIGPPEHDYNRLSCYPLEKLPPPATAHLLSEKHSVKERLTQPLTIGNDVWIGANATILRGLTIGDGAIVGANALVCHDVPPYAIVVGCPARVLKYRFPQDVIDHLLELRWWDWDEERIARNRNLFEQQLTTDLLNDIT